MPLRNACLPAVLHFYFVTTTPNSIFHRQGYQWRRRRISLLSIHLKLLIHPWRWPFVPRLPLLVLLLVHVWCYLSSEEGGNSSRKDKGSISDGGQAWINQVKELKVLFNYELFYYLIMNYSTAVIARINASVFPLSLVPLSTKMILIKFELWSSKIS